MVMYGELKKIKLIRLATKSLSTAHFLAEKGRALIYGAAGGSDAASSISGGGGGDRDDKQIDLKRITTQLQRLPNGNDTRK